MVVDLEERVRELEQKQAELIAQMIEARRQVNVLNALPVQFAELANSVLNLKEDINEITKALRARDQAATDERRSVKLAIFSLTGVILAALIAAVATVIVAKIGQAPP